MKLLPQSEFKRFIKSLIDSGQVSEIFVFEYELQWIEVDLKCETSFPEPVKFADHKCIDQMVIRGSANNDRELDLS